MRLLFKQCMTARDLARIIGQCVSMTRAVLPGKLLLRNCYRVLSTRTNWESQVQLTPSAISDLKWWHDALKGWNGAPLCQKLVDAQVETDASKIGWGG